MIRVCCYVVAYYSRAILCKKTKKTKKVPKEGIIFDVKVWKDDGKKVFTFYIITIPCVVHCG